MSENYFTWRSAVAEQAKHMTGLENEMVDAANDQVLQDQYFYEQLTPQQAAERLMQNHKAAAR
ncbi:hypothetical protein GCM10011369_14660 [Neiella marina]|uniref:Uncharacterized protein n=1 Tax=Neiella marina TaxID=508461 RepID=A0A8J2U497_9GAMM|nr:hypothetical protein [Neiella marina]GGA73910.1 hypothetical protein GCM10011369_14660 [Neiella marina]